MRERMRGTRLLKMERMQCDFGRAGRCADNKPKVNALHARFLLNATERHQGRKDSGISF